jgi:hypothetical protein
VAPDTGPGVAGPPGDAVADTGEGGVTLEQALRELREREIRLESAGRELAALRTELDVTVSKLQEAWEALQDSQGALGQTRKELAAALTVHRTAPPSEAGRCAHCLEQLDRALARANQAAAMLQEHAPVASNDVRDVVITQMLLGDLSTATRQLRHILTTSDAWLVATLSELLGMDAEVEQALDRLRAYSSEPRPTDQAEAAAPDSAALPGTPRTSRAADAHRETTPGRRARQTGNPRGTGLAQHRTRNETRSDSGPSPHSSGSADGPGPQAPD